MIGNARLAARIEQAEAALTSGVVRAVASERRLLLDVAGGVAAWARPGSPMNKAIGIGFVGPVTARDAASIADLFASRGEAARVEISTLVDPEAFAELHRAGFALRGFEHVLGRSLEDLEPQSDSSIAVQRLEPRQDPVFTRIAVDGFLRPDGSTSGDEEFPRAVLEEVMTDLTGAPGMRGYLARIDGVAVGIASCRLEDGIAQLCGATTLPEYRRRGVQRALLAARLADARSAGCELAVVTTAPGSTSQANVQRQGFELLYARAILTTG